MTEAGILTWENPRSHVEWMQGPRSRSASRLGIAQGLVDRRGQSRPTLGVLPGLVDQARAGVERVLRAVGGS